MAISAAKLATFQANGDLFIGLVAQSLTHPSVGNDQRLLNTYYDFGQVLEKWAEYRGNTSWLAYRDAVQTVYGTNYIDINVGNVPGYWSFARGFATRYLRDGNAAARASLVLLSNNAAYHRDSPNTLAELEDDLLSRENAYAGMAHIEAERCGEARRSRLATLLENALSQVDQWCVSETASYFRPFMGALTARFLIHYHQYIYADPRILPAVLQLGQKTNTCWIPASKSWSYTDRNVGSTDPLDLGPQPDLNMLILPYFGWLWWQTGDEQWRSRGDEAFEGGVAEYSGGFYVSGAYLGGQTVTSVSGKQVCQNYVWVTEYLDYTSRGPVEGPPDETDGTSHIYNSAIEFLATGMDLSTDLLQMGLLSAAYTPDVSDATGHEVLADVTAYELNGNGYSRQTLTNVTWTRSGQVATLNCDDPVFTASGGDLVAKYWFVFDNSATSPTKPLLCYGLLWDDDETVTVPDGNEITIDCSPGLLKKRL